MTTLMILTILAGSVIVFAIAIASLVQLVRHEGEGVAHRPIRSHHADAFDPYDQRFGNRAA